MRYAKYSSGFSLYELLLTLAIVTLLLAIAFSFFHQLLSRVRLDIAIHSLAQQWKTTRYQAMGTGEQPNTLCMTKNPSEWVQYAQIEGGDCTIVTHWQSLPRGISIDTDHSTLRTVDGVAGNEGEIYRVSWADTQAGLGGSWGQLGRLVLVAQGTSAKRCLFLFNVDGSWNIREDQKCNK